MKFVYVQVNETQEYVQDNLSTTKMEVLEVLFPYRFIYEIDSLISEKQVKKSLSRVASFFSPKRVYGHDRLCVYM